MRLYLVGFGLLVSLFGFAALKIWHQREREGEAGQTIRLAHWFLHAGVSEALESIAREYEALNPGVKIKIIEIPERTWSAWQRTQLVGETAPDIMQLRVVQMDELLARYFLPLGQFVESSNSYNRGTELEGRPWRSTFVDGLSGARSYNQVLGEYYGVPTTIVSLRMYYNKTLMRVITGKAEPPQSWDEFLELAQRVQSWAQAEGREFVPIAGSKYNTPRYLYYLFSNQTQKLAQDIDWNLTMTPSMEVVGQSYLRGHWDLDTPAIVSGLELMNEGARFLSPDYLTANREDAMFRFTQGRSLMILSSIFDIAGMQEEADFEVGAFTVPHPRPDDPRYGAFVRGITSEASQDADGVFGITRYSKNAEQAVDFLRFLTSYRSSAKFAEMTQWLPVILGVDVAESAAAFKPRVEGVPDGFQLAFPGFGRGLTRNAYDNAIYQLDGGDEGVNKFRATFGGEFSRALTADMHQQMANARKTTIRNDLLTEAARQLANEDDAKLVRLSEAGLLSGLSYYQNGYILQQAKTRTKEGAAP